MSEALTRVLDIEGALDLARTLGGGYGPRDPCVRVDGSTMWQGFITTEGAATLRARAIVTEAGARVTARAWGPGGAALLDGLPELLGADDDPTALVAQHRSLAELQKRFPGIRVSRGRRAIGVLLPTIIRQRVTGAEAHDSYRRLCHALGEAAPGPVPPGLRVPPTAKRCAGVPPYALQRFGIDLNRAETINRVCRVARRVEEIRAMTPADAIARLRLLRGVGPWTAATTVATTLGWTDAVPVGDYHLPSCVSWLLAGERKADDERMLELLEPYGGQRYRIFQLLEAGHVRPPRRGPRQAIWQQQVKRGARARRRR